MSWTLSENGAADRDFTQSHDTLSSAQIHATNLLRRMPEGSTVADVYSETLATESVTPSSSLSERCVCGHSAHPSHFCMCGCSISETDTGRDTSGPGTPPAKHDTGSH